MFNEDGSYTSLSPMFKSLNSDEVEEYRVWAKDNYEKFSEIKGIWHPVIQDECRRINEC